MNITIENVKAQFAKNSVQLAKMADEAANKPGKKYRGATEDYWREKAEEYRRRSINGIIGRPLLPGE